MNEYKQIITSIAAKPYCHFILAMLLLSFPLVFYWIPTGKSDLVSTLISATRLMSFLLMVTGVYMIYDKSIVKKYKVTEEDYKNNVRDLQSTSWENIKKIVVLYFRKYGFVVKFGNDKYSFFAEMDGFRVLIDCKHWDKDKINYHDVVSLYEIYKTQNYDLLYIVSKGMYSERAHSFSFDKKIKLVSGYQLVEWIKLLNE